MIEISREFEIQAAHSLPHTPSSHKCHRKHGHTWTIEVWITGEMHPHLGWIIDYGDLQEIWNKHVHSELDHTDMNDTIPNPTTEIIASWIYAQLQPPLAREGCRLTRIVVREGRRNRTTLTIEQPRAEVT